MWNPFQIKGSLSLHIPFPVPKNPLVFSLNIGETILGSDPNLCNILLDLPEIDKIQCKISIFEHGECSLESLSELYDCFKQYEMIPGHKNLLKLRKNKEYDLADGSVFYLSKYRAEFKVEFKANLDNLQKSAFMSTLFVPDREFFEVNRDEQEKPSIIDKKLDFLPTQNLDNPETAHEEQGGNLDRSKQIRHIFQKAVEKIKKSCRQKNNSSIMEKEVSDDVLSKFVNLFDSMQDEISAHSKFSLNSQLSNTNSKGFSTTESPLPENLKPISFHPTSKNKKSMDDQFLSGFEQKLTVLTENSIIPMEKPKANGNNIQISLNPLKVVENEKNAFCSPPYKQPTVLRKPIITLSPIPKFQNEVAQEQSKDKEQCKDKDNIDYKEENIIKASLLEPTIRQSQISSNIRLSPTIRESQAMELAPTIRESQIGNELIAPTIRESQVAQNMLAATIRESQMLAATIRESQMPESVNKDKDGKFELPPTMIQGDNVSLQKSEEARNEEKINKFIRDSKRNTKKRKIDLPELIKIEKKKNLEKKLQEQQFQSLKLFTKDNLDDLDDLFEKDSVSKLKKNEMNIENEENFVPLRGIFTMGGNMLIRSEDQNPKFEEKPPTKKEVPKKSRSNPNKNLKAKEQEEEKKSTFTTIEQQPGEVKKPKLYLSQKTLFLTSNDSLNLSNKKPSKKKKKAFIEDETKNEDDASSEGENTYKIPKISNIHQNVAKDAGKDKDLEDEKINDGKQTPVQADLLPNEEPINLNNIQENIIKNVDNSDAGTEKIESEKENDKDTDKNEENKNPENTLLNTIKKSTRKDRQSSRKLGGKVTLQKTLTQMFTSQNENQQKKQKPILTITCGGFKITKKDRQELEELNVEIIDQMTSSKNCDVLVLGKLKKDPCLLMAINKGIDVVSKKWLDDTVAAKKIQELNAYHFKDTDFERENNLFLDQMILKAKLQGKLLEGYKVYLNCNNKELKGIVESAGGEILQKMPEKIEEKMLIFVDESKRRIINELVEKNITFYFPDFLIDACLKQELSL